MTSNQIAYQNMLIDKAETEAKINELEAQANKLRAEGQSAAAQAIVDQLEANYQKRFRYNEIAQGYRSVAEGMQDFYSWFPNVGLTIKL